jgi:hypothetical protein
MATGWSEAGANHALANSAATFDWIQLHTGDPGPNGTSNVATENTRKQVVWGSPSGGVMSNSAVVSWGNVPASEDFTHYSAWNASSSGDFGFSGDITANAVTAGDDFEFDPG